MSTSVQPRTVTPVGDKILVTALTQDEAPEAISAFIIPDVAREKPQMGTIAGVGPLLSGTFQIGQTIAYARYSGAELTVDGQAYLVLREPDVLAIVGD